MQFKCLPFGQDGYHGPNAPVFVVMELERDSGIAMSANYQLVMGKTRMSKAAMVQDIPVRNCVFSNVLT